MSPNIVVSKNSAVTKAEFKESSATGFQFKSYDSLFRSARSQVVQTQEFQFKEEVSFYSKEIIRLIQLEDFEDGEEGQVHRLFDSLIASKIRVFKESFQEAWLTLAKQGSYSYFYNFVCAASTVEYSRFEKEADCLLFAALALNDESINDAAIRAIESWEQKGHLKMLENIRPFEARWLEDYRQEVLASLEGLDG